MNDLVMVPRAWLEKIQRLSKFNTSDLAAVLAADAQAMLAAPPAAEPLAQPVNQQLLEALRDLHAACEHVQVLRAFSVGKNIQAGRHAGNFMDAMKKADVVLAEVKR